MENGYYIDWKKLSINQEGHGTPIHPMFALMIAPFIGLAFLMFLPFIGFYLSLSALFSKVGKFANTTFTFITMSPPEVGSAYLTGKEAEKEVKHEDTYLEELDKEIQSRRAKK